MSTGVAVDKRKRDEYDSARAFDNYAHRVTDYGFS
jgi:hypothetical protein